MTKEQLNTLEAAVAAVGIDREDLRRILARHEAQEVAEAASQVRAAFIGYRMRLGLSVSEVPHDLKDGLRLAQADAAGAATAGCRRPKHCLCPICSPAYLVGRNTLNQGMLSVMLGGEPL